MNKQSFLLILNNQTKTPSFIQREGFDLTILLFQSGKRQLLCHQSLHLQ